SIGWQDDPEVARGEVARAVARVEGPRGVLILTDMFGGTPSNIALTFLKEGQVEVMSGVNLPMLIKLTSLRSSADLLGVARQMRDYARDAIWVASDLLRSGTTPAKG
ncbi:MAG: manX, partial [Acidobacteria bacterium]|nr:manX [Acidobacteriota bacterium]